METSSLVSERPQKINVDQLETVILLVDSSYRILDMNRSAQKMFAVGDSRRRNCTLGNIIPYPRKLQEVIDIATKYGSVIVERELEIQFDANYSKVIDCVVSPAAVSGHELGCCFVEISDKESFQKIKEANELTHQSDIWETIARELGHEIKNPLTGIRGTTQLLKEELATAKYDDFIDTILEEVDRLSALSNRMLGGDLNAVKLESVNIHEVLDHVNNLVAAENKAKQGNPLGSEDTSSKNVKIIKSYQPPIIVKGDQSQLTQIFLNLLRNAVQALEGEGEISINTRVGYKTAIGGEVFNRVAEVRVIDNGRGVDPKLRNSIFLPLVSGRQDGTGLGLSIAQKLARANRGIITLERNIRKTEFLVRIPIGD